MKRKNLRIGIMLIGILTASQAVGADITGIDFSVEEYKQFNIDDFDGIHDNVPDFREAAKQIKARFGLNQRGYIADTQVIECPNMTKSDIYATARIWFIQFLGNTTDQVGEARLDESEGTTLLAHKRLYNLNQGNMKKALNLTDKQSCKGDYINLMVQIRLDIKDQKCRLTTTIQDYGLCDFDYVKALNNKDYSKCETVNSLEPKHSYPFVTDAVQITPDMTRSQVAKAKKINNLNKEKRDVCALVYVSSYIVSQIIHDQLLKQIQSSPSYGAEDDW